MAALQEARDLAASEGNHTRVLQMAARLCDRGQAAACEEVRASLDPAEQPVFDARLCVLGDAARCWSVGVARMWTSSDAEAALAAWDRGCDAGHPQSCLAAGDVLRRLNAGADAETRYKSACAAGNDAGCVAQAAAGARLAAADDCANNAAMACVMACDPIAQGGSACERALDLQRESCAHGDAQACTWAGRALSLGWVQPPNYPAAQDLLWRGCDLDDAWGCVQLVDNIDAGRGENPSPKTMAWLRNQVCDLQLDYGCSVSWTATP